MLEKFFCEEVNKNKFYTKGMFLKSTMYFPNLNDVSATVCKMLEKFVRGKVNI